MFLRRRIAGALVACRPFASGSHGSGGPFIITKMGTASKKTNPVERLADTKHIFGEFGGVNKSIEASTTFTVMKPEQLEQLFNGEIEVARDTGDDMPRFLYSRHFNPTTFALGNEISAIEGTEAGYACASGMAAISSSILQMLSPGDHVVASRAIYGGTFAFLNEYVTQKMNVKTTFVNPSKLDEFERAIANNPNTKVVYTETLSNPMLELCDIPELAKITKKYGCKLIVDNTFTPLIFSPAAMGADVVVHSLTKYINGASDVIAGAICASDEFIRNLMDLHKGSLMLLGPVMDPKTAFTISMRIPSLGLRMKEHSNRAMYLAKKIQKYVPSVKCIYPGLPSYNFHNKFKEMMNKEYGFGGIMALDIGDKDKSMKLMNNLQNEYKFGYVAVSLGYFETLMSPSASSTSSEMPEEELKKSGVTNSLIRVSCGYTGTNEQRWKQLKKGFKSVGIKVLDEKKK